MIGVGRFGRALSCAGLGTTITPSEDFPASVARLKCMPNYGRVTGQVCCVGLEPGDPLADGNLPCPDGYGPVPPDFANVAAIKRSDGRAVIVAGPPQTELTDPFRLPGDTTPAPAPPKTPPKTKTPATTAPGTAPAAPESAFARYGGAILVAAGIVVAGLILTRKPAPAAVAVAAPVALPPPAPAVAVPAAAA